MLQMLDDFHDSLIVQARSSLNPASQRHVGFDKDLRERIERWLCKVFAWRLCEGPARSLTFASWQCGTKRPVSAAKVKCFRSYQSKWSSRCGSFRRDREITYNIQYGKGFCRNNNNKNNEITIQYVIFSAPLYSSLLYTLLFMKHPLQCVAQPLGYETSPTPYYKVLLRSTQQSEVLLRTTKIHKVLQSSTP